MLYTYETYIIYMTYMCDIHDISPMILWVFRKT